MTSPNTQLVLSAAAAGRRNTLTTRVWPAMRPRDNACWFATRCQDRHRWAPGAEISSRPEQSCRLKQDFVICINICGLLLRVDGTRFVDPETGAVYGRTPAGFDPGQRAAQACCWIPWGFGGCGLVWRSWGHAGSGLDHFSPERVERALIIAVARFGDGLRSIIAAAGDQHDPDGRRGHYLPNALRGGGWRWARRWHAQLQVRCVA